MQARGQPVIIILAAGKGARFLASGATTHKLDALLNGKAVLQHVLDAVKATGLPWHLVRPQGGTGGMGESIAMGVRATPDAPGWLILPGDLPYIQPASLLRVAQALQENPVVVPRYQQKQGHPVGFQQRYFADLAGLCADVGAKAVVRRAREQGDVLELTLEDVGVVKDVDVVEDLEIIEKRIIDK
ncbi:nucleotidyltransferase family protein [Franconibacter helveticus]|uniref:nucleotidyltransferase family protein n=1 Tax=Franconibacter helveticus TaxID=357240 RepID=UPI00066C4C0A|nr:NTP transferase domain-containing protein [Franconibacter helveticus]